MTELFVNASKKYKITVAENFDGFYSAAKPFLKGDKVAVITDRNIDAIYKDFIKEELIGAKIYKYVINAGENSKNAENYINIMNSLAEDGFKRNDAVITFGGGVVGDLGAFIASTYMRGINLIALPTSLLSMVDSSVGGKTAINLTRGKNLCGTFYQPDAVYINLDFLKTLPEEEKKCGMGEILKYYYLTPDKSAIDINGKITERLIVNCLKIKADIVSEDEKEGGKRKLLNLGHTFGHAIERLSDFKIPHGVCVAKGILLAMKVSEKYLGMPKSIEQDYIKAAERCGINLSCAFSAEDIAEIIKSDKKTKGDTVDAILINKDAFAVITEIRLDKIKECLK